MKILTTILLFLTLTSCLSWRNTAYYISQEPYIVDVNDCSDKALQFQKEHPKAEILVIRLHNGKLHAVNYYDGYLIDCTVGKCLKTKNRNAWGEVIPNHNIKD